MRPTTSSSSMARPRWCRSALCGQLAEGGRLVAVVGRAPVGHAMLYRAVSGRCQRMADFRCRRAGAAGICSAASVRLLDRILSTALTASPGPEVWRESTKRHSFSRRCVISPGLHCPTIVIIGSQTFRADRLEGRDGRARGVHECRGVQRAVDGCAAGADDGVGERHACAHLAVLGMAGPPVTSLAAELGANTNGRLIGTGAGSATMEGALIQAYRNNPQLNAQRAATRATTRTSPPRLSGYRPRVTGTASLTEQYLDTLTKATTAAGTPDLYPDHGRRRCPELRPDRHPDAVQRLPDRQPHAPGRGPGVRRARDAAHDRADRAAQRRHRLHEPAADRGDPRAAAQQRERARSRRCGRRATASTPAR